MLPTDEILEALDLSRAEPGLGFLQALFARFIARVPFETASKILRQAEVDDSKARPRRPEIFWKEHLERGTGGTCFARVAAFAALLEELGFAPRKVLGSVERDFDHAALLVPQAERLWICDVGFPLPALLPAREGRVETTLTDLAVLPTTRGFRVELFAGVPEGPRTLEIFDAPVSEEQFRERWSASFHPGSKFLSNVALRRQEATRILSFSHGEVRVDDRHSRLTVPIPAPRDEPLAGLFDIDRDLLARALALTGDPGPTRSDSRLAAYLQTPASREAAFAAIGHPEAYRKLLEGIGRVTLEESTQASWRFRLAAPNEQEAVGEGGHLSEEVVPGPQQFTLRVRRRSADASSTMDSEFRVEERSGHTYLIREALLGPSGADLLRNDSLRGRLAGALAVDLLAWARRIP